MTPQEVFQKCPKCGNHLKLLRDNLLDCNTCDFQFYINPVPCISMIVQNQKAEILLVKRVFDPFKGTWTMPGGFVALGETIEAAAIRELKEEIGIDIVQNEIKYLESHPDHYLYKGINYFTLCTFFLLKTPVTKINVGDDATAPEFFEIDQLPFSEIAYKPQVAVFKNYLGIS